jgi:hypothetical protein
MEDFITVEWSGDKRRLYKAKCETCGTDRGYKKPTRLKGNCKSCQKKIDCGTLGIIKQCISCRSTEVPDPGKQWFAGPTCYRCYGKEYRTDNREKIKVSIDKWRETNKEKHQASEAKWYQDNKEHKQLTDKTWREANKDRTKVTRREYFKRRAATDPCFKIACALRHRLNEALKTDQKVGSAVRDLGCSIEEFKQHLEAKFYRNPQTGELMTWDNHTVRGWHIDHIRPLSSFDLTDRTQFLDACHYTNMQPLWWRDNIVKGDK